MASPSAKYSQRASTIISPIASATSDVAHHSTTPTTIGINTTAVATRFQVMEKESPPKCAKKGNSRKSKVERKIGSKPGYYSRRACPGGKVIASREEEPGMRERDVQIEDSGLIRTYAINHAMNQLLLTNLNPRAW